MNDEQWEPEDMKLHALLQAEKPGPPLPPRFQEAVWRRIEKAGLPVRTHWADRLLRHFMRPRWAMASLAAMLLISVGAGLLEGVASARQAAQARYLAAVAPSTVR